MSSAAELLRAARTHQGLTQADLARRLSISQAAIARLERPGSNPTIGTLRKALAATGHSLELGVAERPSGVDLPQLMRHLELTPAERLAAHQAAYENLRGLITRSPRDG